MSDPAITRAPPVAQGGMQAKIGETRKKADRGMRDVVVIAAAEPPVS
jgi:hypothetical protein